MPERLLALVLVDPALGDLLGQRPVEGGDDAVGGGLFAGPHDDVVAGAGHHLGDADAHLSRPTTPTRSIPVPSAMDKR